MSDDLLNSLLGDMLGNDEENEGEKPRRKEKPSASDALGGLLGSLIGGGAADEGEEAPDVADLLGGLLGASQSSQPGSGEPDIGDLLGGLLGGQEGGAGDLLGGLLGGGGAGLTSGSTAEIPNVTPIVESLARKFGLPPALAAIIVAVATRFLGAGGASRGDVDITRLVEEAGPLQDVLQGLLGQTGMAPETLSQVLQEALRMLGGGENR